MKEPPRSVGSERGFRAQLTGASLIDLVQMECLARATQVIRVISGDDVGYLYFDSGSVVHAMTSGAVGEPAALEILGWDGGTFEPCNAGWPNVPSIDRPWQALLLLAITRRDEARRDETRRSTVVDFPRDRSVNQGVTSNPPSSVPTVPSNRAPAAPESGTTPSASGILRAVRLEADGKVLSGRGDVAELAEMTAYTMQVAALIGERLGMERLRAVESLGDTGRRLFYLEKTGTLIGLEATLEAELGALREKLGL